MKHILHILVIIICVSCSSTMKQAYSVAYLELLTSGCTFKDDNPFDNQPIISGPKAAFDFVRIGSGMKTDNSQIQPILEKMGYSFPAGTAAWYDNMHGCIAIRHSNEMIDRIKSDFKVHELKMVNGNTPNN